MAPPRRVDEPRLILFSGYLGSGRTTAIFHFLAQEVLGDKWCPLFLDFGEVFDIGESGDAGCDDPQQTPFPQRVSPPTGETGIIIIRYVAFVLAKPDLVLSGPKVARMIQAGVNTLVVRAQPDEVERVLGAVSQSFVLYEHYTPSVERRAFVPMIDARHPVLCTTAKSLRLQKPGSFCPALDTPIMI